MERARAALAGVAVVALLFGGFVLVRVVSRLFVTVVWFAETLALFGLAAIVGYLAYRVLWGSTDDPRYH